MLTPCLVRNLMFNSASRPVVLSGRAGQSGYVIADDGLRDSAYRQRGAHSRRRSIGGGGFTQADRVRVTAPVFDERSGLSGRDARSGLSGRPDCSGLPGRDDRSGLVDALRDVGPK